MSEHIFCFLVIGALLAMNYGLINRLLVQSGQSTMHARKVVEQAIRDTVGDGGVTPGVAEPKAKRVIESYHINV